MARDKEGARPDWEIGQQLKHKNSELVGSFREFEHTGVLRAVLEVVGNKAYRIIPVSELEVFPVEQQEVK